MAANTTTTTATTIESLRDMARAYNGGTDTEAQDAARWLANHRVQIALCVMGKRNIHALARALNVTRDGDLAQVQRRVAAHIVSEVHAA